MTKSRFWVGMLSSLVFLLTVIYAWLRYHHFKGLPYGHFLFYTMNKAISWSSVVFLGSSFFLVTLKSLRRSSSAYSPAPKLLGLLGAWLALLHVVISLPLLNPDYYPQFYRADGGMRLEIETSMILGAFSLLIFLMAGMASSPRLKERLGRELWSRIQRWAYVAFGLAFLHVLPIGLAHWLAPRSWPGYLPPISLLSCLWIAFVLGLRLTRPIWAQKLMIVFLCINLTYRFH